MFFIPSIFKKEMTNKLGKLDKLGKLSKKASILGIVLVSLASCTTMKDIFLQTYVEGLALGSQVQLLHEDKLRDNLYILPNSSETEFLIQVRTIDSRNSIYRLTFTLWDEFDKKIPGQEASVELVDTASSELAGLEKDSNEKICKVNFPCIFRDSEFSYLDQVGRYKHAFVFAIKMKDPLKIGQTFDISIDAEDKLVEYSGDVKMASAVQKDSSLS